MYPEIRWSLKNQLIRIINLCINSFFSEKPSRVFLPLQSDVPYGISFIDKPFFRSWNGYTLKLAVDFVSEWTPLYGYIFFNYGKMVYQWRKYHRVHHFATVEIPLRVFTEKRVYTEVDYADQLIFQWSTDFGVHQSTEIFLSVLWISVHN